MKNKILGITLTLLATTVFLVTFSPVLHSAEPLEKGKVIAKIVCKDAADQSYALYLPTAYDPGKLWPIIYAFDPGANYRTFMTIFQPAAEKYGYILVCSNNSRNGPSAPINRAIWAMWNDTVNRLSIDAKRIYATGFSGGARVASRFHFMIHGKCAGIIACGAGISPALKPETLPPTSWYAIIGLGDFNLSEVVGLDNRFDSLDIPHYIDTIDGGHSWPPEEPCTRAVEWMEIMAMKKGTRVKDDVLLKDIRQKMWSRANNLELQERIYHAAAAYETMKSLFQGLADIPELDAKITGLKKSKAYKKYPKKQQELFEREIQVKKTILGTFYNIENPKAMTMSNRKIFDALQIDYLLKEAKSKDIYKRSFAERLLFGIRYRIFTRLGDYMSKKQYKIAITYLEIGLKLAPKNSNYLYNLACVYSLTDKKKKALKYLKQAVEAGFRNRKHIEQDTDLDNIRSEKEFKELLAALGN